MKGVAKINPNNQVTTHKRERGRSNGFRFGEGREQGVPAFYMPIFKQIGSTTLSYLNIKRAEQDWGAKIDRISEAILLTLTSVIMYEPELTASASAKVVSFDRMVRLANNVTVGIPMVNEKVKSMNQRLQVSDKTMAAFTVTEKKLNDTRSPIKSSRYITVGAAWFSGAFTKVAKARKVASSHTKEKFQLAMSNLTATDSPISI
ncbi:hypothetical protein GIB67_040333 [Kingdonia uniflora]|uniref:Uncharacterized protein n=1 Tax=Kingdonia uniflora TaxID=39325 RepID=A0A7J7L969_9MAGN|nr:hypothetical protein GIB67_040333 [Kingdonia uniflora]